MATQNANPTGDTRKGAAAGTEQTSQKGAQMQPQQEGQRQLDQQPSGMARRESFLPSFLERGFLGGSPFSMMRRMMEDMDRMFEGFGGLGGGLSQLQGGALWSPQVELFQRQGHLVVRADLPGMKEEDIQVEVLDDMLVLQGERRSELEEEQGGVWRSECQYGSFRRVIPLPEGVDQENINAHFQNGVLEISMKLPEQEQRRSRRIEVKGQGAGVKEKELRKEQKPVN